jgi:diguanylate cyclase (GGDEF)-like protein/PAS domain S-box-containing protein
MSWTQITFLTPYIFSALLSFIIGIVALHRRSQAGATQLGLLSLIETEWIIGYIFQLVSQTLDQKLFWNNVQFIGAVLAPMFYAWFVYQYSKKKIHLSNPIKVLFILIPIGILALIWTDQWHGLFRIAPHLVAGVPFSALKFVDGSAFVLYPLYGYSYLLAATVLMLANILSESRIYRTQAIIVLIGIWIPWITTIVTMLNFVPLLLHDVTPLTFGVSNLVISWGLFRYKLFEIVPIARTTLFEQMQEGVIVLDRNLRVVDFNPVAQEIFQTDLQQALARPMDLLSSEFADVISNLSPERPASTLKLGAANDPHYYEITKSALQDHRQELVGYLCVLRDITERKLFEEHLKQISITDDLTGLYNRRHFNELANREVELFKRHQRPFAMILFDLDNFKAINDNFGHSAGDQILRAVARLCIQNFRSYDFIARYGGDEFIILQSETDAAQAQYTAQRLLDMISNNPIQTTKGEIEISISIGITIFNGNPDMTFDRLYDQVDAAMYQAKKNGRSQIFITSTSDLIKD